MLQYQMSHLRAENKALKESQFHFGQRYDQNLCFDLQSLCDCLHLVLHESYQMQAIF